MPPRTRWLQRQLPVLNDGRRVDRREGRPDTRRPRNSAPSAEARNREKFEARRESGVVRTFDGQRRGLEALQVGQQFSGQVVGILEFGVYVDIGAVRDGLLHIKDVSREYFVKSIDDKFSMGQRVDVWIKFIDVEKKKLGLQMFPPQTMPQRSADARGLASMSVGEEVAGKVVRVSEFGVFVEIGAEVEAFLPSRKMKVGRKKRGFKPWEVFPIGSSVTAFVHDIDLNRRRIGLTTYSPEDWDEKLPLKVEPEDSMIDDDEELGGSTRAQNLRALERTLALSLDDDDDEGEEMSAEEIVAALGESNPRAKVLVDETLYANDESRQEEGSRRPSELVEGEGEEIDIDVLFEELARGKAYITVADIMRWDYLEELVEEGEVDKDMVKDLFAQVDARNGRMDVDQLDEFIDLLAEELGLEEPGTDIDLDDDDDDDDDDDTDDEAYMDPSSIEGMPDDATFYAINDEGEDDTSSMKFSSKSDDNVEIEQLDLEDTEEDRKFLKDIGLDNPQKLTLEDHYEKRSKNNELLNYVFGSVAKGKSHVVLADVLDWDFARALVKQGSADDKKIIELFGKCNPKNGQLNMRSFEKFVDLLGQLESTGKPMKKIASSSNNVIQNIEDTEDDVEDFDDNDFDEALVEIFMNKKVGLIEVRIFRKLMFHAESEIF